MKPNLLYATSAESGAPPPGAMTPNLRTSASSSSTAGWPRTHILEVSIYALRDGGRRTLVRSRVRAALATIVQAAPPGRGLPASLRAVLGIRSPEERHLVAAEPATPSVALDVTEDGDHPRVPGLRVGPASLAADDDPAIFPVDFVDSKRIRGGHLGFQMATAGSGH